MFHTFHLAPTKYYYVCNLDSSHLFQFSLKGLFDITDGTIEVKPGWHGKVCRVSFFVLDPELFISVHIVSLVTSRMIDFWSHWSSWIIFLNWNFLSSNLFLNSKYLTRASILLLPTFNFKFTLPTSYYYFNWSLCSRSTCAYRSGQFLAVWVLLSGRFKRHLTCRATCKLSLLARWMVLFYNIKAFKSHSGSVV